jgi:hypothetical protein
MKPLREVMARAFDPETGLKQNEKADLVLGGLARRRFLAMGGLSVATAMVVAACKHSAAPKPAQTGSLPTTTTVPAQVIDDETLLRTASSIEYNAVDAYTGILGRFTGQQKDIANLFLEQHLSHAQFFVQQTTAVGGTALASSNPVVRQRLIDPYVKLLQTSGENAQQLIAFLGIVEDTLAATYQSFVPTLTTPELRRAIMSVGGVEARHSATWTKLIDGATAVAPVNQDELPATTTTTSTIPGTTTTATTVNPVGTTTTTIQDPLAALDTYGPVLQVPGPFGSLVLALGPNSFAYPPPPPATTTTSST